VLRTTQCVKILHSTLDFSRRPCLGEHLLRGADGRHIDHLAFKGERADALRLLRIVGLDQPLGAGDLLVARCEDRLDHINLLRVNGELAAEAQLCTEAGIFD